MRISEIYSATQGEGALLGIKMPFIRVAGCNLACSWCDTAYTWKPGYIYTDMEPQAIIDQIDATCQGAGSRWISLTGGEPTLYHDAADLIDLLAQRNQTVIVETNGLRTPQWFDSPNVFVSCSPKLGSSGQDTPARRLRIKNLVRRRRQYPDTTQYKFVISHEQDLLDLTAYCQEVGIPLDGSVPVYVQPDGYIQPLDKYLTALRWLQETTPIGIRVTPQVHRLVHGPDAKMV